MFSPPFMVLRRTMLSYTMVSVVDADNIKATTTWQHEDGVKD